MRKLEDKNYSYEVNEPNFYGHFLDLEPDRKKQLDTLTIKGKIDILKQNEAKLGNELSIFEIADQTGYTIQSIRDKLTKLKIKPQSKIGKRSYYNKDVLKQIPKRLNNA